MQLSSPPASSPPAAAARRPAFPLPRRRQAPMLFLGVRRASTISQGRACCAAADDADAAVGGATRRQFLQALGCGGGGRGGAAYAANVASRVVKRVLKDRSPSGGPRLVFAGEESGPTPRRGYPRGLLRPLVMRTTVRPKTADFMNKPEDAAKQMNLWVEKFTKGFVTSVLPDDTIDQNTGLVIGSALHFRGRWIDRVDIRSTAD